MSPTTRPCHSRGPEEWRRWHAAKVAAAVLKPKNFKKSLRLVLELANFSSSPKNSSTGSFSVNSFSFKLSMAGSLASSAKPFQYFFAFVIFMLIELVLKIVVDGVVVVVVVVGGS